MGAPVKMRATAVACEGFTHRFRAGLAIPRGSGNFLEFLAVDSEDDPPGRLFEGKLAVGKLTRKRLEDDPDVIVGPVQSEAIAAKDAEIATLLAAASDVAELTARAEKAEAKVRELEAEVAALKAAIKKAKAKPEEAKPEGEAKTSDQPGPVRP